MIHYTCPPVVWASIYNTPLAHSFLPPRSALPHGSLRLVGGPSPQSGVVLLSWCGYSGTLSMQPTQHLETDLRGLRRDPSSGAATGTSAAGCSDGSGLGSPPLLRERPPQKGLVPADAEGGSGDSGGGIGGGLGQPTPRELVNTLRAAAVCTRLGFMFGRWVQAVRAWDAAIQKQRVLAT